MEKLPLHEAILSEVNGFISNGKKRITVLMPAGSGKTVVMANIVKAIHKTTFVIVSRQILQASLTQRKEELFGNLSVTVLTSNDCLQSQSIDEWNEQEQKPLFVLYETTPKERQDLAHVITTDSIVISIGSDSRIKDAQYETKTFFPFECNVFYSNQILDIRDLIIASETDRQIITEQLTDKKRKQQQWIIALRTAPAYASPEATEEDLYFLRERLKEIKKREAELLEDNEVLKSLLVSAGIPVEIIDESVNRIKQLKCRYSDEASEDNNEEIAEAIAEESKRLFAPYVTTYNHAVFSSFIKASITQKVWDKMSPESQNCLVTGKIGFQYMVNNNDDSSDYSGVCILASKALDIEISKRFFHNYVAYLDKNYPRSSWPRTLFDKENNLLTDDVFTLGSVRYIVGIDKEGTVKNRYVNSLFHRYAEEDLYDFAYTSHGFDVDEHLRKCVESVETVRERYRNPAAHRTPLSRVTAEECFDYLVDTYKKLKEILEVMK